MTLAKKVRHARRLSELSQQELARRAGVSVSTVVRIERGKAPMPRRRTLTALAAALGVEAGWLTDENRDLADLHAEPGHEGTPHGMAPAQVPGPQEIGSEPTRPDVRDLLRQVMRVIERSDRSAGSNGARQAADITAAGRGARLAPVFDIGADFDRDWHDGDFPIGHGHDERPAFNGDPAGFWCQLHGDSMEPELREGDLLYFSPEWTTPADGDICLVRTHEFATIKRVFRSAGGKARLAASNPRYPDRLVDLAEEVIQLHKALYVARRLG